MERFTFRKDQGSTWKRIHRTILLVETDEAALRLDDVVDFERRPGTSWKAVSCAVNLSVVDAEGRQRAAVVRYDTSHGFAHRDELFRNPPEKVRIGVSTPSELREMALDDLQVNWRRYLEHYVQTYGAVL